MTRPHGDIDLAVWEHDRGEIEASLTRLGWSRAPAPGEDGGTGLERSGVRLERSTFPVNRRRLRHMIGQRALLVVDVQRGFEDPALGPRDNPHAEENVAKLIAA